MSTNDKILVVDDDRNIVALLQEALGDEGFSVIVAYQGEEALALYKQHQPALLLVDALIPKINGFELVGKIRATDHGKKMPIVMISGIYKSLRMNDQIRDLDIDNFIEKPFDLEDVIRKTKQLLQVSLEKAAETDFFEHKGNLALVSVPRLFYLLYRNRENGVLHLAKDKLKKRITIKNGEPTFVESNLVQECLGKLLVRRGRITEQQVDESLKLMKVQNIRQGQTLINMGLLSANELDEALKDQAREKLLEIFNWADGEYKFVQSTKSAAKSSPMDLSLPQLLLRGVRDAFAMERLKPEMDDYLDKRIQLRKNGYLKFEDFRLATWDERVLQEINGENTLRQIMASKAARELDIYQLVYTFLKSDMIEFNESEEEKQVRATQAKLSHYIEELKQQDYYNVLGISQSADEKAYFMAISKKMAAYHPTTSSLNPTKSDKIRAQLSEITQLLQTAHATLSDAAKRLVYDRNLFLTKGVVPFRPDLVFNADDEFKKLRAHLERGDFEQAVTHAKGLRLLFPKDARFAAHHAWGLFKLSSQRGKPPESALQATIGELEAAIRLDPHEAETYFFLGFIYKQLGDLPKAKGFFNKALMCDENHIEAQRESRLIQMRDDKKHKSFIKWK